MNQNPRFISNVFILNSLIGSRLIQFVSRKNRSVRFGELVERLIATVRLNNSFRNRIASKCKNEQRRNKLSKSPIRLIFQVQVKRAAFYYY